MFVALVNWEKCTGCGDCVDTCPVKCFVISDGKSLPHRASHCIDCGNCPEVCPEDAITVSMGWGGLAAARR